MPVPVGADGSMAAGPQSSGRALLVLRQTLLDAAERRRGAIDAMNYGLSLGVTTHLDEGVFQATNTPNDGAAHEDNYSMHLPFIGLHREGLLPARLRINYLHQDATPELTTLKERLRNTIPFFGDDMIKTGGIGEFIGGGKSFVDAAKLHCQSRLAGRSALAQPERLPAGDPGLRGGAQGNVHCQPALGGRARAVHHRGMGQPAEGDRRRAVAHQLALSRRHAAAERPAVPDDRQQRHPCGHELRRHADRADESVAAHVLRRHRKECARRRHQRRSDRSRESKS